MRCLGGGDHDERTKLVLRALSGRKGRERLLQMAWPIEGSSGTEFCMYCRIDWIPLSMLQQPAVILSLGRIVVKHAVRIVCVSCQIEHPAASFRAFAPAVSNRAVLSLFAVDTFELDLTNE